MHTYWKIKKSPDENSIQPRLRANTTERTTYPGTPTGKNRRRN